MAREIKMTDTQFKAIEDGHMKSNDLETVEITKEYLEYLEGTEKSLEQQRELNNEIAYDKRLKEIELFGAKNLNKVLEELQEEHEGMVQAATLQHLDLVRAKGDLIAEITARKKEEVESARLYKAIRDVNEKLRQANIDAKRAEDKLKSFGTESADLFIEKNKENEELRKRVDELSDECRKLLDDCHEQDKEMDLLKAEIRNLRAENNGLKDRIKKWKGNQPGIQNVDSGDIAEPQTLIPNDIENTLQIIEDRFTSFGSYSPVEVAEKIRKYVIDRETVLHDMMDKLAKAGKKRKEERDLINDIEGDEYIDSLGHTLTHLVHFDDLKRSLNEPIK
ncbi:hypothetical protein PPK13_gp71 [Bacillus phage Ray17]|uniref:Uncharacterized protein n=1 Tax=Bacillus phage Ray17 TaxID=2315627 RepID=A0A386K772_9CAUD|nr:hypothetical protein PPK13_gp71 [Bacillus phage Ray17]AYD80973.1 hypothetical protein Ray17_72 [Bacillus phage Ray17]